MSLQDSEKNKRLHETIADLGQPVSLADELRKAVERWLEFSDKELPPAEKLSPRARVPGVALAYGAQATYRKCADELSALLAQHAVAEPQTREVLELLQRHFESARVVGMSQEATAFNSAIDFVVRTIDDQIESRLLQSSAHAAEQPKLTEAQVREVAFKNHTIVAGYEFADKFDFAGITRGLNALLTSPVAPPPRPLVPLDGGNWYYDAQRDIVMIDGRKYEPAVEEFRIAPPVAPEEQPKFLTCLSCGLPEPSCKCKRNPANENSAMCTPPAQERASDEALEDLPQIHYVATRGEPEPSGYYVPIKEAKKLLATAAKQAREEVLEEAAKHRPVYDDNGDPDSCVACDWKPSSWTREIKWDPTGEWERHIRAIAAQPSPQTRLSNREEGKK